MLMLKRKAGETVLIGDDISVTVTNVEGGRATLAVRAPREIKILREELESLPPRRTTPSIEEKEPQL